MICDTYQYGSTYIDMFFMYRDMILEISYRDNVLKHKRSQIMLLGLYSHIVDKLCILISSDTEFVHYVDGLFYEVTQHCLHNTVLLCLLVSFSVAIQYCIIIYHDSIVCSFVAVIQMYCITDPYLFVEFMIQIFNN